MQHLGRHVAGSANLRRALATLDGLCQAKVANAEAVLSHHEDILRFQVAVHDFVRVQVCDGRAHLLHPSEHAVRFHDHVVALEGNQVVREIAPLTVFHDHTYHQLRIVLVEEHIVVAVDVRVIERLQRLCLAQRRVACLSSEQV